MFRFSIAIAAPLASALLTVAPASARDTATDSVTVRYSDLAIDAPAGRATFQARLDRAVDRVCGRDDARDLAERMARHRCRTTARADGETRIAAVVENIHNARYAALDRRPAAR